MTWNDLINLLQEIPENRREEKAAFMMREDDSGGEPFEVFEIDCKEEVRIDAFEMPPACDIGNDETTFVLAQ